ncbi:MAG: WecB/TagA/CpsF family glycosyltransferase [Pseudomonadota bacterium]
MSTEPTPLTDTLPAVKCQRILRVSVSELDLAGTVERIIHWSGRAPARVVITANLDHVIKLRDDLAFARVYDEADLVTPDGMPFVWLSRREGTPLKERVTGSDLIAPLAKAAAEHNRRVFLFGSTLDRLHAAAKRLKHDNPDLDIVGAYAPPMGFEDDASLHTELVEMFRALRPDIVFVALGAPKQEFWSTMMADSLSHGVFVNIGGGLDFLSRDVKRAPAAMQSMGLEWLWRAVSEPLRLGPRYLRIIVALPGLYLMHRADRAAHERSNRHEAVAATMDRRYRTVRAVTREAERERAHATPTSPTDAET